VVDVRERVPRVMAPVGEFFGMAFDTVRALGRRPFAAREFSEQVLFLTRVSLWATFLLTIPFLGLVVFLANQLLIQLGAVDIAGAGTGFAAVSNLGPIASALVVAGAGSTAMCADLGARTVREEIDALQVFGIDPVQRLVLPRVLAATLVSLLLNGVVGVVGIATGFLLSVGVQGASPGQFAASLSLLIKPTDVVVGTIKALVFGATAGLVACFRGLRARGGPKGLGDAVNETVVLTVVALFLLNAVITIADLQMANSGD
jgi:phospholipid/cholesterol/gamma-HCH transport system permease protein